jgi:hypothetical protein
MGFYNVPLFRKAKKYPFKNMLSTTTTTTTTTTWYGTHKRDKGL